MTLHKDAKILEVYYLSSYPCQEKIVLMEKYEEKLRYRFKQGGLIPSNPPLSRITCINGAMHINVETLEVHYLSSHPCQENVALMEQYEENVKILV